MTHFKVVSKVIRADNSLFYTSAIQANGNNPCRTLYKIGEFARSPIKNSGLFVFSDLDSARVFCRSYVRWRGTVFTCEIGKVIPQIPFITGGGRHNGEEIVQHIQAMEYLKRMNQDWTDNTDVCEFDNTVFTDKVKLIKEI